MSATISNVRRAMLYGLPRFTTRITNKGSRLPLVPGSSLKMLEKTKGLAVDSVAYDLEDSVTMISKAQARANIRHFLNQPKAPGIKECAVRINAVGSGLEADDLAAVVCSRDFAVNLTTD